MSTKNYIPFTYLIGWSKLDKWYYGVRVKHDTIPSDLWTTYFTSSKHVRQFRLQHGEPDVIEIRHRFLTKESALLWEHRVLTKLNVKKNDKWLNVSYGYGDTHSIGQTDSSKEKISLTRKTRLQAGQIKAAKHTEEHKQKLREYNPGGEATAKAIYQIDATTGQVIKEWKSTRQAGLGLNINSWRNISTTANRNKVQTVGGFYWRWVGDTDVVDNKLTNLEELNDIRLNPGKRAGKQVQQLDELGNVIKIWNNMCEAGRHFELSNSTICAAIKANSRCAGFYWKKIPID